MFRSVVVSVLTGALAGIQFELFANEVPNAALLNACILHVWIVVSGMWSGSFYQYIFQSKIPLKWSLGIVVLVRLELTEIRAGAYTQQKYCKTIFIYIF